MSGNQRKLKSIKRWLRFAFGIMCVCARTCLVRDIDWRAGRRAVSSTGHSVDGDDVVSTRLQVLDCGSGLRARHCELLGITVTS